LFAALVGRGGTTFTRLALHEAILESLEVTLERFPTGLGDPERDA
jgi:hypothetical protein